METTFHRSFSLFLFCSFSLLTGGLRTPPNPEKVEKVSLMFLLHFLMLYAPWIQPCVAEGVQRKLVCWCTSAAVVGGVLTERLWASGHFGGGLEGITRRNPPPLYPILCVSEAVWWLLFWWGPGMCALTHTYTHYGGIHIVKETHYIPTIERMSDVFFFFLTCSQLMRTSFMKHELIELPFVEHSQCECR